MRGVERCHLTSPRLCETSHAERAGYALPRGAWGRENGDGLHVRAVVADDQQRDGGDVLRAGQRESPTVPPCVILSQRRRIAIGLFTLSRADALRQLPSRRHPRLFRLHLLRLIRQARGQPALHLGERHALAGGVPHRWEDEE